jgi:hypothetical protein
MCFSDEASINHNALILRGLGIINAKLNIMANSIGYKVLHVVKKSMEGNFTQANRPLH